MFLSEMGPPQYRGALNNMFQLATSCGILIAQLVNFGVKDVGPFQWRVSLAVAGALSLIQACVHLQSLIHNMMSFSVTTNHTADWSRGC